MTAGKSTIDLFRDELFESGVSKLMLDYIDARIRQICEQEIIAYLNQFESNLKDGTIQINAH